MRLIDSPSIWEKQAHSEGTWFYGDFSFCVAVWKYTVQWLLVHLPSCAVLTINPFRTFPPSQWDSLVPQAAPRPLSSLYIFWTFHISGITQHTAFCVWLLSHSMMCLGSFTLRHVWGFWSFSSLNGVPLWMNPSLYLCTRCVMDIWAGSHSLPIKNNAALKILSHLFERKYKYINGTYKESWSFAFGERFLQ